MVYVWWRQTQTAIRQVRGYDSVFFVTACATGWCVRSSASCVVRLYSPRVRRTVHVLPSTQLHVPASTSLLLEAPDNPPSCVADHPTGRRASVGGRDYTICKQSVTDYKAISSATAWRVWYNLWSCRRLKTEPLFVLTLYSMNVYTMHFEVLGVFFLEHEPKFFAYVQSSLQLSELIAWVRIPE